MEVLALTVIDEHMKNMTESNINPNLDYTDIDMLKNNLKNGWIVLVMLSSYIESFVNTILRDCINYKEERLLKGNLEDKIEIIYLYYKVDLSPLKGLHTWCAFRKAVRIRNELLHYKYNDIGFGGGIPLEWKGSLKDVGNLFTYSGMKTLSDAIILFSKQIVSDLGLKISPSVSIFESDGRDGLVSYVYDETITCIDPSRFN